jgi:hypothetical protein
LSATVTSSSARKRRQTGFSQKPFLFRHLPTHFAFWLISPSYESEFAISEFKTPRSRAEWGSGEVTSIWAWQKTWQKKTAEECQIVQKIAGRRDEKTPENAAEHRVLAA